MASNARPTAVMLTGGLNVASGDQLLKPGECIELTNYELTTIGRYMRMTGYERFDGQPSPSTVIAADLPGFPFPDVETTIAAIKTAQQVRRDAIQPVPGSGPVRGVFMFEGDTYAFRNTADGLAAKLYRATAAGWDEVTTPVLQPNGRYETIEANFTGAVADKEIIGVDGANPAFRFDGTTFTQITGPITPDQPTHLTVLPSQKLIMTYRGGSLVYSEVGDPAGWDGNLGAGEIAVGYEIIGVETQADSSTAIFCRDRTFILYGKSEADFNLTTLALRSGAIPGTIQTLGTPLYLDDRGLTRLDRVQAFGNFDSATLSQKVQPLLQSKQGNARCSMVLRGKNQYRLFFGDNTGLGVTMYGGEVMGFFEFRLGFTPFCTWSGELPNGTEVFYAGGDNGYLYQLEKGFSHDGADYLSSFQTSFLNFGRPEDKKRWRKLVIEADSVTRVDAQFRVYYDYTDPNIPLEDVMFGSGSKWDLSDWDDAIWGGASTSWTDQYIDGVSRSLSVYMSVESDYYPPHQLAQLFIHASPRGRRR
uniref:hypothetical protein n=1 Tax=Rheinheimera sp. TaxID=1869214 RepID=UPI004048A6FA